MFFYIKIILKLWIKYVLLKKKMNMNNFFLNNFNLYIERGKVCYFVLSNCDESIYLLVMIIFKRIDLIVLVC